MLPSVLGNAFDCVTHFPPLVTAMVFDHAELSEVDVLTVFIDVLIANPLLTFAIMEPVDFDVDVVLLAELLSFTIKLRLNTFGFTSFLWYDQLAKAE